MKAFEKIKENDKYIAFNKVWGNKRYHGLIVLGIWFIFFAIVIIFLKFKISNINSSKQDVVPTLTINEILSNINSYSFTYEIQNENETKELNGSSYNNEFVITLDSSKYYIKDYVYIIEEELLKKVDNPFEVDISKINIKSIYEWIKDKNPLYESNENDTKISTYKVLLNNLILESVDEDIEITINKKENKIEKISLDLTNYINYYELKYKKFILTLTIDDINDIEKFNYSVEE